MIGPAAIADAIEYERQVIDGIECCKGEIQVAGNSGDITQYRPKIIKAFLPGYFFQP